VDIFKMDLVEIELGWGELVGLAKNMYNSRALLNAGSIKCWEIIE
jgi:hypothetical protein